MKQNPKNILRLLLVLASPCFPVPLVVQASLWALLNASYSPLSPHGDCMGCEVTLTSTLGTTEADSLVCHTDSGGQPHRIVAVCQHLIPDVTSRSLRASQPLAALIVALSNAPRW